MSEYSPAECETIIKDVYRKSAMSHEACDSQLIALPFAPETYPGQAFDSVVVEGARKTGSEIYELASWADPTFQPVASQLAEIEDSQGTITSIAEMLGNGQNVIVWSNHGGRLTGPGLTGAAFMSELHKKDPELFERTRTQIIVGKLVPFLSYRFSEEVTVTCIDVLRQGFDTIFVTIPNTPSTEELEIPKEVVEAHNAQVGSPLVTVLKREKGNLVIVTPNGTTDDSAETRRATLKLFRGAHSMIVPTAVWYKGDKPIIVCEKARPATIDNCRDACAWLVDTLVEHGKIEAKPEEIEQAAYA